MRLQKQLLFLSLVMLALPWVGCQYINEMDAALRKGQADALTATARAVGARIISDPVLSKKITEFSQPYMPFYAHTLGSPLVIDGYVDDWVSQGLTLTDLPEQDEKNTTILLGVWRDKLYVFVKVTKSSIRYFNPSDATLDRSDHLVMNLSGSTLALFASAPGQLKVVRTGEQKTVSDKTIEHQVKGYWLEWSEGYQIEATIPLEWTREGINFGTQYPGGEPVFFQAKALVSRSEPLSQELDIFSSQDIRLYLVTNSGHIVASSGNLQLDPVEPRRHGLIEWIYQLALRNRDFPDLNVLDYSGIFTSEDVRSALSGEVSQAWHHHVGAHSIARASLPIISSDNEQVGVIVAEQSSSSLAAVTNNAFNRLLVTTFLASTIAGVGLVLYATWLSFRIRRLSHAAAHAISESGKIMENFPVSTNKDEIGELSRSYAQLLSRLREYTSYLRTLSSNLSHELRTPLAIVRSSLDNLDHEKLNKQAVIYAERAREGTTRLSNILNAMSAASRVEQTIDIAEREAIPCNEILASLKDAYEDVYQHVSFQLNIHNDPKGLYAFGSGELLVQALDKLVDNAADFCPENGLIELGLYRHQDIIVFTVRNEGPPLPRHMQGQLFDSMVSVRDKNLNDEEGHHLGLGLYIVRLISDFHNGEVHGYNVPDNSGVIFEMRLPAATKG